MSKGAGTTRAFFHTGEPDLNPRSRGTLGAKVAALPAFVHAREVYACAGRPDALVRRRDGGHECARGRFPRSDRGRSSAGRALAWHARGQGFDPPRLHHRKHQQIQGLERDRRQSCVLRKSFGITTVSQEAKKLSVRRSGPSATARAGVQLFAVVRAKLPSFAITFGASCYTAPAGRRSTRLREARRSAASC